MDVLVFVWANIGLVIKTPHIKYEFLKLKIKITSIKVYLFLCPYHCREPYEKWGERQIKTRDTNV